MLQINCTFEPGFEELYKKYARRAIRGEILSIEGISRDKLDIGIMSKLYFTRNIADISIDYNANANEAISPNGYLPEISKGLIKLDGYNLLWKYAAERFGSVYADELISSIWDGAVYFHDCAGHGVNIPYCFAYSTQMLMIEGRPYGQLNSLPPKRTDSFISNVIELTLDMSQDFAGAIAPADLIVNYCYYLKKEQKSDKEIVNDFQKFVHVVNNKFRMNQSPFVNLSIFDRPNLERVFKDYRYPDGSAVDVNLVLRVQELFARFIAKGDPKTGLPYRFPIVTWCLYLDSNREIVDKESLALLCELNKEKGVFNIYLSQGEKIASCCRLLNDPERMRQFKSDTFGNGGLNLGSSRVVTLNLPHCALMADGNQDRFFYWLDKYLKVARDLLLVHREEILFRRIKGGFLKFFEPLKWFNLNMFFNTLGIIGVYETCYFMDLDIKSREGQEFVFKVLKHIENKAVEFSKETGWAFNVEEIPGESAAVTLAQKGKILFGEKQVFELYSNQYLPLIADVDPIERIELTGKFMDILSGGGILHLNVKDPIPTARQMEMLVKNCARAGVSHMAINYGYGICEDGHVSIVGNAEECPVCRKKIVNWATRIVGYLTLVSSWNPVRREFEFKRRTFKKVA